MGGCLGVLASGYAQAEVGGHLDGTLQRRLKPQMGKQGKSNSVPSKIHFSALVP